MRLATVSSKRRARLVAHEAYRSETWAQLRGMSGIPDALCTVRAGPETPVTGTAAHRPPTDPPPSETEQAEEAVSYKASSIRE
jgi:hypothetical protein